LLLTTTLFYASESKAAIEAQNNLLKKIFENQQRLRDNIKSLQKVPGTELIKRYLKDLDAEEDEIIKVRGGSDFTSLIDY